MSNVFVVRSKKTVKLQSEFIVIPIYLAVLYVYSRPRRSIVTNLQAPKQKCKHAAAVFISLFFCLQVAFLSHSL
jgi:hypothetical protein